MIWKFFGCTSDTSKSTAVPVTLEAHYFSRDLKWSSQDIRQYKLCDIRSQLVKIRGDRFGNIFGWTSDTSNSTAVPVTLEAHCFSRDLKWSSQDIRQYKLCDKRLKMKVIDLEIFWGDFFFLLFECCLEHCTNAHRKVENI